MTRSIDTGPFGLDLDLTLSAGQAFGWRKEGDVWLKRLRAGLCAVSARGRRLLLRSAVPRREVARYFRLDDDFESIAARLARDPVLSRALATLQGLRLVREDPWECLATYLVAQNSTIRRTEAAVFGLARAFGGRRAAFPRFPEPEELARATLRDLAPLRLGSRAPWRAALAREVARGGLDLEALRQASYEEALGRLLALEGVGRKTADCVALYSLEKLEAFPIDTWIRKALKRYYGVQGSDARLRAFAAERFGGDEGYAQLYLFAFARKEAKKKGSPDARSVRGSTSSGWSGRRRRANLPRGSTRISVGSEAPASLELRVPSFQPLEERLAGTCPPRREVAPGPRTPGRA
ncbi:MAG: DNA-3-methyladenine glycosylase family protein, partial [Planctomycetota bacterium]